MGDKQQCSSLDQINPSWKEERYFTTRKKTKEDKYFVNYKYEYVNYLDYLNDPPKKVIVNNEEKCVLIDNDPKLKEIDKRISDYGKIVFSTHNNLKLNKLRQIFNGILELDDHLQNLSRNCFHTLETQQRIERQGRDLVNLTKVVAVRITELETEVDPVEENLTIEPFSKPEF